MRGRRVAGLVRVGISVDFEHTWLPKAMARFSKSHPKIVPELRVDRIHPSSRLSAARNRTLR